MKLVLIQKDSFVKLATMSLSAVLKANGHQCEVLIEDEERDIKRAVIDSSPDIIGFSCTTGSESWVIQMAREIKKLADIPIIVGGPHATFFPQIIEEIGIDMVCRGEGENVLVELLDMMASDPRQVTKIANLWVKRDGEVFANDVRSFIEDLDTLPLPDWDVYIEKYRFLGPYYQGNYPVMTSRGCPYECSYCFNDSYKKLYKQKGKYVRRETAKKAISHLVEVKERYNIRRFNFVDDCFVSRMNWLEEFSQLYQEQVKLPFICNVRADSISESAVRHLKAMGCYCLRMGIESGNDRVRREILNKTITSEQIRKAARLIKKSGTKLTTYNIYGNPGESLDEALDTLRLNREIKTDFAQCSILQPYPGTKINAYAEELKVMRKEPGGVDSGKPQTGGSYYVSSVFDLADEKEILNLQKLTQFFIRAHVPLWVARKLIKIPQNPLFHMILTIEYAYFRFKMDIREMIPFIKFGLHSKSYMSRSR